MFRNTNSATVCQNCVFAKLSGCQKMKFSKRKLHFWILSSLCWKQRNRKKKNKQNGKGPKTYKNTVFKVVIQKVRKRKKQGFFKTCLTLFVSGREKNAHFRAHYLFWPKTFWGPKQLKPGKAIKIVVSAEIPENLK